MSRFGMRETGVDDVVGSSSKGIRQRRRVGGGSSVSLDTRYIYNYCDGLE